MATLTIHNIPDDLLEKLERSAKGNSHTVDEEAVLWLSRVEIPETPEPQSAEDRIRGFRELMERYPDVHITDEQITRAKREGRLGDSEDDPYKIVPSSSHLQMKPEEFIEYTQQLSRKLEGKVWVAEEDMNRAKSEGRLGEDEDYAYRIIPTKSADPTTPEHRLESNTGESSREPDPWLERAKALRESMPDVYIGDEEELNRFKREGRL